MIGKIGSGTRHDRGDQARVGPSGQDAQSNGSQRPGTGSSHRTLTRTPRRRLEHHRGRGARRVRPTVVARRHLLAVYMPRGMPPYGSAAAQADVWCSCRSGGDSCSVSVPMSATGSCRHRANPTRRLGRAALCVLVVIGLAASEPFHQQPPAVFLAGRRAGLAIGSGVRAQRDDAGDHHALRRSASTIRARSSHTRNLNPWLSPPCVSRHGPTPGMITALFRVGPGTAANGVGSRSSGRDR